MTLEQIQKHDEKHFEKKKVQACQALLTLPEDHPIVQALVKLYDGQRKGGL